MILIYVKRLLMHPGVLLMLFIIPFIAVLYKNIDKSSDGAYVGIYSKTDISGIFEDLKDTEGFTFVEYTDEQTMRNDVMTQKLECGFIFPENMEDMMDGGAKFVCGYGYTSVLSDVTCEAVFAAVLKNYGDDIALKFGRQNGLGLDDVKFCNNYNNYLKEIKSAVAFEETEISGSGSTDTAPFVLGIISIFTACAGLIGCVFTAADRKKGINMTSGGNTAAALLLFAISELAACGIMDYGLDITRFLLFNAGIWGICCLLTGFIRDERYFLLLMPLTAVMTVLFDILNIGSVSGRASVLEYVMLSHYYIYFSLKKLVFFVSIFFFTGLWYTGVIKNIVSCIKKSLKNA